MELFLVKGLDNRFTPAFDSDLDKAKKIKPNETVKCVITKPRNVLFHRKFMALVNLLYSNQSHYNNFDHLRRDLTIAAGFYEERYSFDGECIIEAKSISFANMEEDEFQELYNRVLDVVVDKFHFNKEEILEMVEQYF